MPISSIAGSSTTSVDRGSAGSPAFSSPAWMTGGVRRVQSTAPLSLAERSSAPKPEVFRSSPVAKPARAFRPYVAATAECKALVSFGRERAEDADTGERRAPAFRDCGSLGRSRRRRACRHQRGGGVVVRRVLPLIGLTSVLFSARGYAQVGGTGPIRRPALTAYEGRRRRNQTAETSLVFANPRPATPWQPGRCCQSVRSCALA
jgi:hypothetical protein